MDVIFNSFKKKVMDGSIDLDTDTIMCALVASGYTPDQDAHEFLSDITNEIANGNGYTTGGQALTTKTVTKDNTENLGKFDADDVSWPASTITARGAVLYKSTGVAGTSPLIAYIDFGADKITTSGTFTIQWNASGIITLS